MSGPWYVLQPASNARLLLDLCGFFVIMFDTAVTPVVLAWDCDSVARIAHVELRLGCGSDPCEANDPRNVSLRETEVQ